MKIIITENQYTLLKETKDKPKVYNFPSLDVFGNEDPMDNWNLMLKFLDKKGNPDFTFTGNLYLAETPIESLGNLTSVGGNLELRRTSLSEKYTEEEIRNLVEVKGDIYL